MDLAVAARHSPSVARWLGVRDQARARTTPLTVKEREPCPGPGRRADPTTLVVSRQPTGVGARRHGSFSVSDGGPACRRPERPLGAALKT
jgi:hypothetical protein